MPHGQSQFILTAENEVIANDAAKLMMSRTSEKDKNVIRQNVKARTKQSQLLDYQGRGIDLAFLYFLDQATIRLTQLKEQKTQHIATQQNIIGECDPRNEICTSYLPLSTKAGPHADCMIRLGNIESKLNVMNFQHSKSYTLLNDVQQNTAVDCTKEKIPCIDPQLIMPNDDLIYCGALRGESKLQNPPETRHICLPNANCRSAFDWHRFSSDLNFLRNGGVFEDKRLPQNTSQRGTISLFTMESELKDLGLLDTTLLVDLRQAVKEGIERIMEENSKVNFEGHYIKNGTLKLCILTGSLLFLEDVEGLKSESLMKASDSKVFLQVSRRQAEQRQFTRRFVRPNCVELPHIKKSVQEFRRDLSYFDNVTWWVIATPSPQRGLMQVVY